MPSDTPKFTLITLSYRSEASIERCLKALTALGRTVEIIHADNGSEAMDFDALKAQFPSVIFMPFGENLGYAAGNNRAAKMARGQWLGFINPDAFVAYDWLKAMKQAVDDYPTIGLFTSLQFQAEDTSRLDGAGDALTFFGFPYRSGLGQVLPPNLKPAHVFSPCGAAFIIRRDLFEYLGGFDENFFCYCEDVDLGFRARLIGESCVFVPSARVDHIGSASTGVRSDFALFHGYRNRLWMYVRNMPLALLLPSLPLHIGLTLLMALVDTLKGKGGVVWRGIFAALTGMGPILKQRKSIQEHRQISALRLAKSLTWSPLKILSRTMDHRSRP